MKYKTAFLITAAALLWISLFAGQAEAEESKARPAAWIDRTSVSFPPTIAGSVLTKTFRIQNTGDAPLSIPGVYAE